MFKTALIAVGMLLAAGTVASAEEAACVSPETELAHVAEISSEQGYAVTSVKLSAEQSAAVTAYYNSIPPTTTHEADTVYIISGVQKVSGVQFPKLAVVLFKDGCKVDASMMSVGASRAIAEYLATGNMNVLKIGEGA